MAELSRLQYLSRPSYLYEDAVGVENKYQEVQSAPKMQKILSENMPRPLDGYDSVVINYNTNLYDPPPVDSLFTIKEQGSSNPRFLRTTLNIIPSDSSTCSNLGIPIGAIWHPFAEIPLEDDQVQTTGSAPLRCIKCMAYINPYFKFINSHKCICNFCGNTLNVSEEFLFNPKDRPEFTSGSYEFKAPAEYLNRPAQPFFYVFCVDISCPALKIGLIQQVIVSIQAILDSLPYPSHTYIGLIAYDTAFHVYKINNSDELEEIIMNDIEDPFISEPVTGCCFNLGTQRASLENLLKKLENWEFVDSSNSNLPIGAVINTIKEYLLKKVGGRVLLFTTQSGSIGKFSMTSQIPLNFIHSEKEKGYLPSNIYLQLSQECIEEDVCVDIFAFTQTYIGSNNLCALCSQTGGDFYYFPEYNAGTDAERLYYLIVRILTRPQYSQVTMRVRCSNGLSIDHYIGKYKPKGPVEMQVACIDSDKTLGVIIKYDEKLKESSEYYIQCAVLYTNILGERFIRINNARMIASSNIQHIYRSADIDTINSLMLKMSSNLVFEEPLNVVRDIWHTNVIKVLVAHRKSSGNRDFNRILVPEKLRLMPLYCNSSMKLPALTLSDVPIDLRISSIHQILSMPTYQIRLLIYPKIYKMHDIIEQSHNPGTYNEQGLLILPTVVGCSIDFIKSDGIYIINNGLHLTICIGKDVNPALISKIWGVDSFYCLSTNPAHWPIPEIQTEENEKFLLILQELKKRHPGAYLPTHLYFDQPSPTIQLKSYLSEDPYFSTYSYNDFLIRLHKVVQSKFEKTIN